MSNDLALLREVRDSFAAVRGGVTLDAGLRRRVIRAARAAPGPALRLVGRAYRTGSDAEAAWASYLLSRLPRTAVLGELARILADPETPDGRKSAALGLFATLDRAAERRTRRVRVAEAQLDGKVLSLVASLETPEQIDEAAALVLSQIPEDDLEAFCAELTLRGGERAVLLVRAIAARAVRPFAPVFGAARLRARPEGAPRTAAQLKRRLAAQPEDAASHSAFGLHLLEAGDLRRATFHLERAAALAPETALHHWNVAVVAERSRRLGRLYLALRAYVDCTRLAPGEPAAQLEAARRYLGEYERGVAAEHPGVDPSAYARGEDIFAQAYTFLVAGSAREAAQGFLRVLRLVPGHYPAWSNLGAAYAELGLRAEAIACLRQALALKPGYGVALRRLEAIEKSS